MRQTVIELQIPIPVIAVLLFVLCLIALLVIVDSKTRISGEARGLFSIAGQRRDHPIWAWMVSALIWLILGWLIVMGAKNLVAGLLPSAEDNGDEVLIDALVEGAVTEERRVFHNPREVLDAGDRPVCVFCHGDYPHSKEPMIRTMLNMHTQFVGCLTCHADPDEIPEENLTFRWLNFSGVEVTGAPFGIRIDPTTGGLAETDDYYSRIVAYRVGPRDEELLEVPESREDASEFAAKRGELTSEQEGVIKNRFHTNVAAEGRACSRCHAPEEESYLPFRELGFEESRIYDLTNLNVVGIIDKYIEFHIPGIFKQPGADESPARQRTTDGAAIRQNPRDWWSERFDPRPDDAPQGAEE